MVTGGPCPTLQRINGVFLVLSCRDQLGSMLLNIFISDLEETVMSALINLAEQ